MSPSSTNNGNKRPTFPFQELGPKKDLVPIPKMKSQLPVTSWLWPLVVVWMCDVFSRSLTHLIPLALFLCCVCAGDLVLLRWLFHFLLASVFQCIFVLIVLFPWRQVKFHFLTSARYHSPTQGAVSYWSAGLRCKGEIWTENQRPDTERKEKEIEEQNEKSTQAWKTKEINGAVESRSSPPSFLLSSCTCPPSFLDLCTFFFISFSTLLHSRYFKTYASLFSVSACGQCKQYLEGSSTQSISTWVLCDNLHLYFFEKLLQVVRW